MSLNSQQYTSSGVGFTYYRAPSVSLMSPDAGPTAGSTLVRLFGEGLDAGREYRCKFGDDVVPYAIQIVQKLSEAFATYSKADDDDEEASMAAAQCIETVCAVLQCASTRPDVYAEIEPHIVPVVATIFSGDGDYICLLYTSPSPRD